MMEEKAHLWNLLTAPSQDGWQAVCGMGSEFKEIFMHWREKTQREGKKVWQERKKMNKYKMETKWLNTGMAEKYLELKVD